MLYIYIYIYIFAGKTVVGPCFGGPGPRPVYEQITHGTGRT